MIRIKINETPIYINGDTKDVTFKAYFKSPHNISDIECYVSDINQRVITTTPIIVSDAGNLNLTNVVSYPINYSIKTNFSLGLLSSELGLLSSDLCLLLICAKHIPVSAFTGQYPCYLPVTYYIIGGYRI